MALQELSQATTAAKALEPVKPPVMTFQQNLMKRLGPLANNTDKSSSETTFERKKVPRIFNLKQAIEQGRNKHKNNLSLTGREELMNS
jgi:hypothetical protein